MNCNTVYKCDKCEKTFISARNLEKHKEKKIPCNRILKCEKCNHMFKDLYKLKKHQDRKTPCSPLHGDPTIKVGDNTCIYCRKVFRSKYSVKPHLNICKIKNGGMDILFNEVKKLKEKNESLQEEMNNLKTNTQIINNDNSTHIETQNNHFNTVFKFNFINFGEGDNTIKKILDKEALSILSEKVKRDIPLVQQITNRVINLIGLVFRNPDYKELQGIYVVDLSKINQNAFYHEDGDWILSDWEPLRAQLLQKLYNCLSISKENKKQDILDIMKYLFVLGKCGECKNIKRLHGDETLKLYQEIGDRMKFKNIII